VGLYRALLDGDVMYIGKAYEHANGGFRKRLADYTRASDSGRRTGAGPRMFEHRDQLMIDVLVTGEDAGAAIAAIQLEHPFINRYDPPWNRVGRP
jgi:excinuclease UvrABC nuclease subunit